MKSVYIDNRPSFQDNLDRFLKNNPNIKIICTIIHNPYHVSIIYDKNEQLYTKDQVIKQAIKDLETENGIGLDEIVQHLKSVL